MPLTNLKHVVGQNKAATIRPASSGPANPLLSRPASPEWNPKDSSHIKTATEGTEALDRAMGSAESLLASAPEGSMSADEIARVSEIESKGWAERLGGVMSALEFIDRPRKLISLAVRDFVGTDERAGQQFGLDAYADTLLGKNERLVEKYGESSVGRDGHLTFSSILDDFWSHDDDDPWWDKATRGLLSFGGDVGLDPLTYVTFGATGVGASASKAAAGKTVRAAGEVALTRAAKGTADDFVESAMERTMRELIEEATPEFVKKVEKVNLEQNLNLFPEDIITTAREWAAGKRFLYEPGVLDDATEGVLKETLGFTPKPGELVRADSFVNGVVGEKLVGVTEAVANRNFGTLKRAHKDYIDHVFLQRTSQVTDAAGTRIGAGSGFSNRLGEAFTTGGMRIGTPFGVRMQSRPLKMTQGAFEDWAGLRTLHKIPQSTAGKKIAQIMPFVDAQNPFIQVARRRFEEADSPLKALNISELDWMQTVRVKAGLQARNDVALQQAFREAASLTAAMKKSGVSEAGQKDVWAMLFPSLQSGRVHPNMVPENYAKDVVASFTKTQQMFSTMLADSYSVIKRFSVNSGHIDNYVPLVFSDEFQRAVRTMREMKAPLDGADLEKSAARLSRFLPDGEEISIDEAALFMEAYESLVKAATGATRVGEASSLHKRTLGNFLEAVDPNVNSKVLMGNFNEGQAFSDQLAMNDSLSKVLRAISASGDYPMNVTDDVSAFVTDPIKLLNDYVSEIANVAEQRAFLEAGKKVGAVNATLTTTDVDRLMHSLGRLLPAERARVEKYVENRERLIEGLMNEPENPTTIHLGMGATIDLPQEVVDHPQMVKAISKLKAQFGRLERSQKNFLAARDAKVKRLVATGLSEENAHTVATVTDKAMIELRGDFSAAVEEAYLSLDEALTKAYFEVASDGRWGNEMLEAARAQREYLTKKSANVWSAVENQYLAEMQVKVPVVQVTEETVLDPGKGTEYAALVASITGPVRENMSRNQGNVLDKLRELAEELQDAKLAAIAKRTTKVDKNAVAGKHEIGQVDKALQAEIRAFDEDTEYLWGIIDAVATAKATDDELGIIAATQAQKQAQATQARAVATVWDTLIQEGIERRRLVNPKIADEVEELWRGVWDEEQGKWVGGFYNTAMANEGSIIHGQLDTPNFWKVVADGVEQDWHDVPLMHAADPEFWKGAPNATHVSKDQIVQRLQARIDRAEDTLSGYAEMTATRKARTDMTIAERQAEGAVYSAEDLQFAHAAAQMGVSEPEAVAKKALATLQRDMDAIMADDANTTRQYIQDNMKSWLEGQIAHGELKASKVTAGLQVGDSLVAAERAFQILASAANDPALREQLGWALEIVNKQLAKMPGSQVLREGESGTLILATTNPVQQIPSMKAVLQGVTDGVWTRDQLSEKGLGYLGGVLDVSDELKRARKVASQVSGSTTRHQRVAAEAMEEFENLVDIIDDVNSGVVTAQKLRNFVQEGSSTGTVRESAALKKIKKLLPPEKIEELDRTIQAAYMADPRVTPQGRQLLAMQDEAKYNRMLFKPLEKTFADVDKLSSELQAQKLAARVAEHKDFLDNADTFLRELTFIDEWRRSTPHTGTALENYSKRIGPAGKSTLVEAMGDLKVAAKRLNRDGPFTFESLLEDVRPRRGAEDMIIASDEAVQRAAVGGGQSLLDDASPSILTRLVDDSVDDIATVLLERNGKDFVVAFEMIDGKPNALGMVWEDANGWKIGVDPRRQNQGIGKRLARATEATPEEMLGGTASISEDAANLANSVLKGRRVTTKIPKKGTGYSEAQLRKIYGGDGAVNRAVEQAQVTVSRGGQVSAESFGLSGVLGEQQMDAMVAAIFRNMVDGQKYMYTPEGMGQLRNTFHTFLRGWRSNATVARPNFHFRNAISAAANGFLIGVGPQDYSKVMPDYFAWRKALHAGATEAEALAAVAPANRYIFEAAIEQNILSTGFVRADFSSKLSASTKLSINPYNAEGRFAAAVAGGKVMESMEDVFRLTSFQKYLDPQYVEHSGPFARQMTMMVHFDYQDLTTLERRFKSVAPFFIWTRRNVPLQLKTLMEHPGNMQVFHHFSDAMNDNFGTEEYFASPLPSFYGALAMPTGIGQRDGEENWLRFVFDPELPLSNLENLPILDREASGMVPISMEKTLSPAAWINYMSELMGPQISLPVDLLISEDTGGYQTNAPVGLNQLGLMLENIDYFNMLNAEGGDWLWSDTQKQMFDTMFPFFKDATGAFEQTPSRASRFGLTDDTGYSIPDRLEAGLLAGIGGGGGLKTQTPQEATSRGFESSEIIRDVKSNAQRRSTDNPFAFNENPDNNLIAWAESLTNGGV